MKKRKKILIINLLTLYPISLIGIGCLTHWAVPIFILMLLTAYGIENRNK